MAYIIAASCSDEIIKEWRKVGSALNSPPIHRDYALMKVLYYLRRHNNANTFINHIQWTSSQKPLNFDTLTDEDIIYVAGHGNEFGLYAMGPNRDEAGRVKNLDRLIHILTQDGSLKKKARARPASRLLKIVLLSCRAGVAFYVYLAGRLYEKLAVDFVIEGAHGFTFGSPRTLSLAYNEVLIYGLPWHMEYQGIIDLKTAEEATTNREGVDITFKRKEREIKVFKDAKGELEKDMKKLVEKLKNTEVNKALDELFASYATEWGALVSNQFDLYTRAKVSSNLEFDMWFGNLADGYVSTNGSSIRKQHIREYMNMPGTIPSSLLSEK